MYEFKMSLFENKNQEGLLLTVWNYNIAIKASGALTENSKLQYLGTLLRGEALRKFETVYVHPGSTTMKYIN